MPHAALQNRWLRWSRSRWAGFHLRSTMASYLAWPFGAVLGPLGNSGFGVITYHRVCDSPAGYPPPTCSVRPATFHRQLAGLLRRGYEAWPLSRCVEAHRRRQPIPRRVFTVVFDDGYENIYTQAWPILRELQIPATVFAATAYLNSPEPMPFDDWPGAGAVDAADTWRHLSLAQCREMQHDGLIEFGSHTHTHQDFRGREHEFRADMLASLSTLRDELGVEGPPLALPYGFLCPGMMDVIRELPLACCVTCEGRLIRPEDEPFFWGRFGADRYDTPGTLAAKLNGWYSAAQNAWRRLRGRPFEGVIYNHR